MMRGIDADGVIVLGITRHELEGIVAGKPCYFTNRTEVGGGPPIALYFAEDDAALIQRIREMFSSGPVPFPRDLRTRRNG
jgi:hypothetical protein